MTNNTQHAADDEFSALTIAIGVLKRDSMFENAETLKKLRTRLTIAAPAQPPIGDVQLSDEEIKKCVTNTIGFGWETGELQTVNADDLVRIARALSAPRERQEPTKVLTTEDVERQYENGNHIGSGLPRETCPCGFCAKHRLTESQGE